MARDFSPITFFQRTPNALLGRYFHQYKEILQSIVFDEMEETRASAKMIFEAFTTLPEPKQAEIEAEFQDIESMAHQAGVTALIDEATDFHKNADFPEAINRQDSFHGKVMWTFLTHPNYWAGATSILHAANIADAYWKKRNDLPHIVPLVEPEDAQRLKKRSSGISERRKAGATIAGWTCTARAKRKIFLPSFPISGRRTRNGKTTG